MSHLLLITQLQSFDFSKIPGFELNDELTSFAKVVLQAPTELSFDQFVSKGPDDDSMKGLVSVRLEHMKETICFHVLPPPLVWPAFRADSKQQEAPAPHVLTVRQSDIDRGRIAETIYRLKSKRDVVWFGHDGIGKSIESSLLSKQS